MSCSVSTAVFRLDEKGNGGCFIIAGQRFMGYLSGQQRLFF
jgi:hypothetical protein